MPCGEETVALDNLQHEMAYEAAILERLERTLIHIDKIPSQ